MSATKKALPDVKLMIGEPFVIREGSAVDDTWFPEFNQYQEMARKIADEFDAALVPYQQKFDQYSDDVDPTYWSADGVHPSLAELN
ncbi:MAG: hypothetical protein U5K69_20055 [Balneolaceae bacterium]|nr:hypothetical protein [Balneolaceae bacterium]